MSSSSSRAVGRAAFVCLVVLVSLSTVFLSRATAGTDRPAHAARRLVVERRSLDEGSRERYPSAPSKLVVDGHAILAFPPTRDASVHPLTVVYLHGMRGRAENGCPWLRSGASEHGWLVCPEGVVRDESGAASWGGDVSAQAAVVARAVRAAEERGASREPGVAIGFSQGGYVALDLVKTRLGHFRGLVLVAAPEAHPSARKLHDAGVVRVALAAGSFDAAYAPLLAETQRLESEGMEARFFDLGHVGHTYAAEDPRALRDAIAWAAGAE